MKHLDQAFIAERAAALKLDITATQPELDALCRELEADPPQVTDDALFTYRVPKLSEDGSCSLVEELEESPFDLRGVFKPPARRGAAALEKIAPSRRISSAAPAARIGAVFINTSKIARR